MLSVFALSRRVLARLRRANNVFCCVENARSAFSTQQNTLGDRRRRDQAIVMESRQTRSKNLLRTPMVMPEYSKLLDGCKARSKNLLRMPVPQPEPLDQGGPAAKPAGTTQGGEES